MAKYVKNFMEWVDQMNKEYWDAPSHIRAYVADDGKYTILVNHRTGKIIKAKCHENDIFDETIGIAIVWARYKGYEIPKERKIINASKLKYGQHFYFMNKGSENIFVAKHPLNNTFIYSRLDSNTFVAWNQDVYLIQ